MTVRVPAKVNLQLAVGASRPDGMHDLVTVFQAIGLYDDVTATPSGSGVRVSVEGEGAGLVPVGEDNLAARAARAARLSSPTGTRPAPSPSTLTRTPEPDGVAVTSS